MQRAKLMRNHGAQRRPSSRSAPSLEMQLTGPCHGPGGYPYGTAFFVHPINLFRAVANHPYPRLKSFKSPFGKGGFRGISTGYLKSPPPPFVKGGGKNRGFG